MSRRSGDNKNWNYNDRKFGHSSSYSSNERSSGSHDFHNTNKSVTRTVKFKVQPKHYRYSAMRIKDNKRFEGDEDMKTFFDNKNNQRGTAERIKDYNSKTIRFGVNATQCGEDFPYSLIVVPYAQTYEKSTVMNSFLKLVAPDVFIPLYWKEDSRRVGFFVDDNKIAAKLRCLPNKFINIEGHALKYTIYKSMPLSPINDELRERLKQAMSQRYNLNTKALDLSKLHEDRNFKEIFVGLMNPAVMSIAIEIMQDNVPDLEALNLNDNFIYDFICLRLLANKFKNLKILYLDGNRLNSLGVLNFLKGLQIVELSLKRNPFLKRFHEKFYVRELRKKFPKLIRLDGKNLEPLIGFETVDVDVLPLPQTSFIIDSVAGEIVQQFIQQYFSIFDSDNRQALIHAYHDQAMLSLTTPTHTKLSHYSPYSRNFKSSDLNVKSRNIRCGKLLAISLILELPKTQHDPMSFTVDILVHTPKMIMFIVTGLFKEFTSCVKSSQADIRAFVRNFIIVPAGNGYSILNELYTISNPTAQQYKAAFKQPQEINTSNSQSLPSTSNATVPSNTENNESIKIEMVQALSQQSKMNLGWSKKCLEETNWDYNLAINTFTILQEQNQIPAEAFIIK